MHLTFDQMSSGFHHNFCPEGPTNFHQLQNFWMPGPAVRSVATSHWSVPRPAGISYPEMPWKNRQSWHNRNRLHLHLWVSFSKLSILLLHLLRSQGDETMKGSVGGSKVSDAQNHLPRSKKLRSSNWNDLQFTGLLHSRQGIQVTCWTQWRWWWRHALKSTGDQLLTPRRVLTFKVSMPRFHIPKIPRPPHSQRWQIGVALANRCRHLDQKNSNQHRQKSFHVKRKTTPTITLQWSSGGKGNKSLNQKLRNSSWFGPILFHLLKTLSQGDKALSSQGGNLINGIPRWATIKPWSRAWFDASIHVISIQIWFSFRVPKPELSIGSMPSQPLGGCRTAEDGDTN